MILPHRSLLLALLFFPVLCSCLLAPRTFDEDAWRLKVEEQNSAKLYAAHEKDGRFFNPWLVQEKGRFGQFLKWRMTRSKVYTDEEESYLPGFEPDLLQRLKNMPADKDFLVWIGHATFLIRLSGSYWLTDPILSERALLPKRLTSPALSPGQLGELDGPLTVVISHNHYDHFDQETLEELPAHTRFIVPLGLGELVSTLHGGEVTEIDWWQEVRSGQTLVTGLPAQHWSRRIGQGHNRTLWASYMIESPTMKLYYGGDSGYFVGYREFGRKFGPVDYALLPTTAYQPRWFMHYPHMNVDEALRAFNDLQAHWFVPTQWGTFRLGDNPPGYPMLDLKRQINARALDPDAFLMPDLGQILVLGRAGNTVP